MSMFQSHSEELYHVGGHVAKRSMLSDANALRPSEGFSELFPEMVARAVGPAPQTRRRRLSDRCDQPSPERHGFGLGALLERRKTKIKWRYYGHEI